MTFFEDIKSKHLTSYVLVTIGKIEGQELNTGTCVLPNNTFENFTQSQCDQYATQQGGEGIFTPYIDVDDWMFRISTQKVTLGGHYYKPILLNIPSISESLDVENRKYKISSVRLSISDYEEDGVRFSDSLNQLMNQEVNIFYATSSCKTLEDCYLSGTFIVRSFTQDEDKIGLNCEDLSQDKLHKDLPLSSLLESEGTPDKYKSKPIPMVFGKVDKSPTVFTNNYQTLLTETDIGIQTLFASLFSGDIESPLYFYTENGYVNIILGGSDEQNTDFSSYNEQFRIENNKIIFNYSNKDIFPSSESFINKSSIFCLDSTKSFNLVIGNNFSDSTSSLSSTDIASELSLIKLTDGSYDSNIIDWAINGANHGLTLGATQGIGSEFVYGQIKIHFKPNYSVVDEDENGDVLETTQLRTFAINGINFHDYIPEDGKYQSFINEQNYDWITQINPNTEYPPDNILDFDYGVDANDGKNYYINNTVVGGIFNIYTGDSDIDVSMNITSSNNNIGLYDYLNILVFANLNNTLDIQFRKIIETQNSALTPQSTILNYNIQWTGNFNEIELSRITKPIDILSKDFYVSVIGRGDEAPTLQKIYEEILGEDILDFDGTLNQDGFSMGSYAFTLDKKINSKKLLEEISKSSGSFPYFKNGDFNVKSIKKTYTGITNVIYADDVLSYKYDRTKIEKIVTRVNVKYHYDYGLKDFTKETGYISNIAGISTTGDNAYNTAFFGDDFDQELVFESKYIRDISTAINLAKYLYGLHANQHNLITVKLPLNYLNFELGDIVKFDKLIQGRNIFGEDYKWETIRNGQIIYPYFFITQIRKNLENVEIKLYQLHQINYTDHIIEEEEITQVGGCMDAGASNYDPDADYHVQEMCDFPDIPETVLGCTDNTAINYNPDAEENDGSCVLREELSPATIIVPSDNFLIEYNPEGENVDTISNNLINNPNINATFDNNIAGVTNVIASGTSLPTLTNDTGNHLDGLADTLLYNVFENNALEGFILLNVNSGESEIITVNANITLGFMSIQATGISFINGDIWQIIDPSIEEVEASNQSEWITHSSTNTPLNPTLFGGNQSLIINWTLGANQYASVPLSMGISSDTTYLVSFSMRTIVTNTEITGAYRISVGLGGGGAFNHNLSDKITIYLNNPTQEFSLTEEYQEFSFEIVQLNMYLSGFFTIKGLYVDAGVQIEIDNVSVQEVIPAGVYSPPTLTVNFYNGNLFNAYGSTEYNTVNNENSYNAIAIFSSAIDSFLWESHPATYHFEVIEDLSTSTITINLDDTYIPPNTPLGIAVVTRCSAQYNSEFLFLGEVGGQVQVVSEIVTGSWGEVSIDPPTSSMNLDEDTDMVEVVSRIDFILNQQWYENNLSRSEYNRYLSTSSRGVVDIVDLVDKMLDNK